MSWGKGITVLLLGFVGFMSWMVYMAVKQDFYLVTENYYTEGLDYDVIQEKIERVKKLKDKITFDQSDGKINITMPTEVAGGTVHFFRPSNGTLDFKIPIVAKAFYVDKTKVKTGKWIMKFEWTDGVEEYYFEESIAIL